MRVPSKSKNAPVVGPSGLRSTSSTSVSTTAGRYRIARSGPSANRKRLDEMTRWSPAVLGERDGGAEPTVSAGSVDERDRALRAVGHRQLRLVEQFGWHVLEERDAVALVVGLEHLGGEHVAAAVAGAGFGVDAEFHGRDLTSAARLTNCRRTGSPLGSPR